jgi:hypothetical protein
MAEQPSVRALCNELADLATAIRNASSEQRTFNTIAGWNAPALDREDLAQLAEELGSRITTSPALRELDEDRAHYLSTLATQVSQLKVTTLPQLFNGGNIPQAAVAIVDTLTGIWLLLLGLATPEWDRMTDPDLMPRALAQRVRGVDAHLKQIEPDVANLQSTIALIRDAHDTARSLPADLEMLREAHSKMVALKENADADQRATAKHRQDASTDATALRAFVDEGKSLIQQLQDLHRVGTSTALAGAFDARAKSLSRSVVWWAVVLVGALASGVVIGSLRVAAIDAAMQSTSVNWEGVWVNVVLTALGVAAPVWLGWVATKQIVQRFRLAEDYAYKASISNAYEGYRREAVDLDSAFRNHLFGSALTRLDELPGRLVEQGIHGSPLHELASSPLVQRAVTAVPDFGKDVVALAKRALASLADEKSTASSIAVGADNKE